MLRRSKVAGFIVLITFLFSLYIYKLQSSILDHLPTDFSTFDNVKGSKKLIVPNIIHFIHFDSRTINFVTFICMLSAWYNHKPSKIYLHTNLNVNPRESRYLWVLQSVLGGNLKIHEVQKPTHVFGQKLSSVQHASDVARIKILMKYGGIYLDEDVFVVKNLNVYRHYECALGWPENQNMGSQVLFAHKDARFLKLWLELYREYRPTMWYFNAGESPTQNILNQRPDLVHRVKLDFGVENLSQQIYKENWTGWINRYTLHLLSNHNYLHNTTLDEVNYRTCNCTFATLANQILSNLEDENIKLQQNPEKQSVQDTSEFQHQVENFLSSNSSSLLKKYLNFELFYDLEKVKTIPYGSSLNDVIRTGLKNPDSAVGIFAPDADAYRAFRRLFLPVILDYHKLVRFEAQPEKFWGNPKEIGEFEGNNILSTRIRIARSIKGFPFNNKMTEKDLISLESKVSKVLREQFSGEYLNLAEISPEDKQKLKEQHFLFEDCDRFILGAGGCVSWPTGRGIFLSSDRQLIVWVNEEDHLRIISLDKGGDLPSVYSRLILTMNKLEKFLEFEHDEEFGYLTFCPTNLGTTLRASVHLRFSALTSDEVERLSSERGLQVRGTSGEHSEVRGGVYDLSNSRRLGLTEFEAVSEMFTGIQHLLREDKRAEGSL